MNSITINRTLARATVQYFDTEEELTPDPEINAFLHHVWLEITRADQETWANYTMLTLSLPPASCLCFYKFMTNPLVYMQFQTDLLESPHEASFLFIAMFFNQISQSLEKPLRLKLPDDAYIPSHIETIVGKLELSLLSSALKAQQST
jgi:hypothetical protein